MEEKMIIEGILDKISRGENAPAGPFIGREYIKINDTRLKHITTTKYIDNVLVEYVGKNVKLSICKSLFFGNMIVSFKDSDDEVHQIEMGKLLGVFFGLFLASFAIGFAAFFGIALIFESSLGVRLSMGIGGVVFAFLVLYPIITLVRRLRDRNAIN
jgi:hypothetical protein